jgi:hypothetical protein
MTNLEWCETLGLIADPDENRLGIDEDLILQINDLSAVFSKMIEQKAIYGAVNPDVWLEFVPWHSLN